MSARVHARTLSPSSHPLRDAQFQYIAASREFAKRNNWKILSIDIKKREVLGNYRRAGSLWVKDPRRVGIYKPSSTLSKDPVATPLGIYDVEKNQANIYITTSRTTAEFSATCLSLWVDDYIEAMKSKPRGLLVLLDAGGCDGATSEVWRCLIWEWVSKEYDLPIIVEHYPQGCSKWNPIEHRVFGPLTVSWQGLVMRDLETMVEATRRTRTETGLTIEAEVVEGDFKICDQVRREIDVHDAVVTRHSICPDLNYLISPSLSHFDQLTS